jgi:hypothetical protein
MRKGEREIPLDLAGLAAHAVAHELGFDPPMIMPAVPSALFRSNEARWNYPHDYERYPDSPPKMLLVPKMVTVSSLESALMDAFTYGARWDSHNKFHMPDGYNEVAVWTLIKVQVRKQMRAFLRNEPPPKKSKAWDAGVRRAQEIRQDHANYVAHHKAHGTWPRPWMDTPTCEPAP